MSANYQTLIWKQADSKDQIYPSASDHGWTATNEDLVIDWCSDPVPQQLVDILYIRTESETNTSDDTDTEDDSALEPTDDYDEEEEDDDDDDDFEDD